MFSVPIKALLVGTGALLASLVMIATIVPAMGEAIQPSMYVSSVIGCYAIGTPVSWYCFRQAERYRKMNAELVSARGDLERLNKALRKKAEMDQMTGMLNRETFLKRLRGMGRYKDAGTLLIVDADHFKSINDRFGHLSGDNALMAITGAIRRSVRENDIIGRLGGEEFGVMLVGANLEESRAVAERIRTSVETLRFEPRNGVAHRLTVSIGGAPWHHGAEFAEVMRFADTQLYSAKENGRNRTELAMAA